MASPDLVMYEEEYQQIKDTLHRLQVDSNSKIIFLVAQRAILVVIFDEKSSLGLVRLRVKKASQELERTFEQLLKKSEADRGNLANRFDSPFAEITDEDIDSLFSE